MKRFVRARVAALTPLILASSFGLGNARTNSENEVVARNEAGRCIRPGADRPYVCDVGEPRPLSMRSFREILANDIAVRETVRRLGFPDRAEVQKVDADAPWLGWEVRTFYDDLDRMFVYGRTFILDRPEASVLRYQGRIPDYRRRLLDARSTTPSLPSGAEEAADRAERAAAVAEDTANRLERIADRVEAMSDQMDRDFKGTLVKR